MMARTFGLRLGEAAAVIARMTRPFDRPAIGAGDRGVDHAMRMIMRTVVMMAVPAMVMTVCPEPEPVQNCCSHGCLTDIW